MAPHSSTLEWVAFPSPGDLPDPGIEPTSAVWQADSLPLNHLRSQRNTILKTKKNKLYGIGRLRQLKLKNVEGGLSKDVTT